MSNLMLGIILGLWSGIAMVLDLSGLGIRTPIITGLLAGLCTGNVGMGLQVGSVMLINSLGFYTYGGGGDDHLSGVLQDADEDPTNPNNMVTFYTRDSIKKTAATVGGKVVWNREHVWPKNKSNDNWGTTKGGTDILHLRPTYETPNSTRSNHPYGYAHNGTKKSLLNMDYGWLDGDIFEPLDCVKGDAARIIMYVWTVYNGYSGYSPLSMFFMAL